MNLKRNQSGMSMTTLLMGSVIIALLALLGMKLVPEYIEYYQIIKITKTISNSPDARSTVADVRKAFDRHADLNNIKAITAQDLDITKEGEGVVIGFSYEQRVPLFANVSLLLDFQGSSGD